MASRYFTCNIQTRDDSFVITGIYLCDNENASNLKVNLPPYTSASKSTQSNTYLGNWYYFLPEEAALASFNDKDCYIVMEYTESGVTKKKSQFLFTLLDIRSLSIRPESAITNYYEEIPAYYSFQLLSGVDYNDS